MEMVALRIPRRWIYLLLQRVQFSEHSLRFEFVWGANVKGDGRNADLVFARRARMYGSTLGCTPPLLMMMWV